MSSPTTPSTTSSPLQTSNNESTDPVEDLIAEMEAEMCKLSAVIDAKTRQVTRIITSLLGVVQTPHEDIRCEVVKAKTELETAKKIQEQLTFIEEEEKLSRYGKLHLMEMALKGDEGEYVKDFIALNERSYQGFVAWLVESFPREWLAFDSGWGGDDVRMYGDSIEDER